MKAEVREVYPEELEALLELYTCRHENGVPPATPARSALWESLLEDPRYHILVA